jgi:H+-transporting ATPase
MFPCGPPPAHAGCPPAYRPDLASACSSLTSRPSRTGPRSGYVLVAWIWSAIWYVLLDPIKWALCYVSDEDGFRTRKKGVKQGERRQELGRVSQQKGEAVTGMTTATVSNPLGRASIAKPAAMVLDREKAAEVPVHRNSDGLIRVSNDPNKAMDLARRSRLVDGVQRTSVGARGAGHHHA